MNKTLPLVIQAAKLSLSSKRPYLSAALWSINTVETDKVPIMAVDKYWRLYYNSKEVEKFERNEIEAVLYHEILHLLREHAERLENLDVHPMIKNIAADAEINPNITHDGFSLPEGSVVPKDLGLPSNKLAEEYVELLRKKVKKCKMKSAFVSGSCAHGHKQEWEKDAANAPKLSDSEKTMIRRRTALAVKEAGNAPDHMKRWADTFIAPSKVNWRRELSAAVTRAISTVAGCTDYTYSRMNRRQGKLKVGSIIMPSLYQPVVNITVVIDSSGSMDSKALAMAMAELKKIMRTSPSRANISIISCDTEAHLLRTTWSTENIHLTGGGGTHMGEGLRVANTIKPHPNIIVVLTDGYTPWPETWNKSSIVVIGIIGSKSMEVPSWAKKIIIE